jgi:ketosteroid isomerase-like protein
LLPHRSCYDRYSEHTRTVPDAGIYHGREGFFSWLARWGEAWESWRHEDLEVRAVGDDRVLALFRLVARGKGSGVEIQRLDAIAYMLRDAKVIRMEYFNDRQQALEAVGLREQGKPPPSTARWRS